MNKPKIMVVDDDPLNVKLMSAMLSTERYAIESASDGREAIEKIKINPPDIILLDAVMPHIDGFEVLKILKGDTHLMDIPVVMLTGLDGIDYKIKGLEYGADEFISKPINLRELTARVESLLKLKNYQDHLKTAGMRVAFNSSSDEKVDSGDDLPTILLVEDDEKDIKIIQSFLVGEPYRFQIARTGEEAMTVIQEGKIDVILLDMLLPGLDGFQVCRLIKTIETTKNIQIVVLTNLMDLESKIKGINLGADEYLIKPVNRFELKVRIKALLKKKIYLDRLCENRGRSINQMIEDDQTGLMRSDYFNYIFDHEIRRCRRQQASICLLLLEIGTDRGPGESPASYIADMQMKSLGGLIRCNIRDIDSATRIGKERFAVLLIDTDADGGAKAGLRIKKEIEKGNLKEKFSADDLIVKFGTSEFPGSSNNLEEMRFVAEKSLQ